MKETAQQLNEVVVTALGIEKQKTNLGYSISDVNGNEVVKGKGSEPDNRFNG